MAGFTLTPLASLTCPHGGKVVITPTQTVAQADRAPMATKDDATTVTGCPFQIPGTPPIPSPCVKVIWTVPDTKVKAGGIFTLSQGSVGLCMSANGLPQGAPIVASTQAVVKSL